MNPIPIVITALIIGAIATPLVRYIARRTGKFDHPDGHSSHAVAIPVLGGIGLYVAVLAAVIFWNGAAFTFQLSGVLLGASIVSALGFWDDQSPLRPWTKLTVQLAAAIVLIVSGVAVQLPLPVAINWFLTIMWVVGVTNAFNLIDNMDGLSAGIAAVSSAFFLVMSVMNGQVLVGTLSAAVLGASLGFLFYNFNPATIFMGDSGSLFLGFILAVMGIKVKFPANEPTVTWVIPILVLAVPLFDISFVAVTRMMRSESPFTPGRDHVSHRLRRHFGSDRKAVLTLYATTVLCGTLAIGVSIFGVLFSVMVSLALLISGLAAAHFLYRNAPAE